MIRCHTTRSGRWLALLIWKLLVLMLVYPASSDEPAQPLSVQSYAAESESAYGRMSTDQSTPSWQFPTTSEGSIHTFGDSYLFVPPGAVNKPVTLTLVLHPASQSEGAHLEFGPHGLTFAAPLQIELGPAILQALGIPASVDVLHYVEQGACQEEIALSGQDAHVTFSLHHFSKYYFARR